MPRYTTTGIPPEQAALGLSAFMPHFNRLAAGGAMAYKGGVTGQPGTAEIRISAMDATAPSPDVGDIAQMGGARSSDAPNSIWPNLYYVTPDPGFWPGAGMPVQMYDPVRPQDTTMIPVPATDLRGVYIARSALLSGGVAPNQGRSGTGSSRGDALKQAFNFVRWPQRRTGNGPGTGSP